jgi:haloalkane dehalogenase
MSQPANTGTESSFRFAGQYVSVACPGLALPGNSLRLHYVDEGPPGARPLLCLHGNPTWSYLYRNIIPPCVSAGYRALALDNMGYGLSDKPADVGAHTARRHADNLQAFIEALDLRQVVIVGHAWGAYFGLAYAASHPDNVAGLILLNGDTFAKVQVPIAFQLLIAPGFGELIGRRFNLLLKLLLYFGTSHRERLTRDVMTQYGRPFPDYASRAAVLGLPRMIPGRPDHPTYPLAQALEAKLHDLTMPVLLIAGSADRLIGEPATRRLQAQLPHAESLILAQAGHYLQEDGPEAVAHAMLSFLSKQGL